MRIDLHTHSVASPDGGLTSEQYIKALDSGLADYIAVTDHNRIDFAAKLRGEIGDRIIVGEEILTDDGEIIGLFLERPVQPGLSAKETIKQIKEQGGLVYVPHPFETVRKGLHPEIMERLHDQIDLVEVCNGRAFAQNRSHQAVVWAKFNHVAGVAASDAHGIKGIGRTYVDIEQLPTRENLVHQIKNGKLMASRPSMRSLLYPKYHVLRKKVGYGHRV